MKTKEAIEIFKRDFEKILKIDKIFRSKKFVPMNGGKKLPEIFIYNKEVK